MSLRFGSMEINFIPTRRPAPILLTRFVGGDNLDNNHVNFRCRTRLHGIKELNLTQYAPPNNSSRVLVGRFSQPGLINTLLTWSLWRDSARRIAFTLMKKAGTEQDNFTILPTASVNFYHDFFRDRSEFVRVFSELGTVGFQTRYRRGISRPS